MPVEWQTDFAKAPASSGAFDHDAPVARVIARPHQSMTPQGFVVFIAATCAMVAVPLIAVLGSPVLWGILPFLVLAISGLWVALRRSQRDAQLNEVLTVWPDRLRLVRQEPRKTNRVWEANPYWVSVHLYPGEKPVEHYLTLKGGGREVEFGAFLSPDERVALYGEVESELRRVRNAAGNQVAPAASGAIRDPAGGASSPQARPARSPDQKP